MDKKIPKEHIARITKASSYFIFRNGPIKDLYSNGKISDDELKDIQVYLQNHLAYLYNILLEENDIKKFDLIVSTMNNFYVNDSEEVMIDDSGFDTFYKSLFPSVSSNITFNNK